MKYLLSTIVFLVLANTHELFAQKEFKQGFVVTLENDTIRGLVKYRGGEKVQFMPGNSAEVTKYSPTEIHSFRAEGEPYFVSKELDEEGTVEVVFAELLFRGAANVYFHKGTNRHYYYEIGSEPPLEVTLKPTRLEDENGAPYNQPSKTVGKLKVMMSEFPEIFPVVDDIKINRSSIINLAKTYHELNTTDAPEVFEKDIKRETSINFSIHGGLAINKLNWSNRFLTDSRTGPVFDVRMEIQPILHYLPGSKLQLGIGVQTFNEFAVTDTVDYWSLNVGGMSGWVSDSTSIEQLEAVVLRVPVMISQDFSIANLSFYINGGVMNKFVVNQNEEVEIRLFNDRFGGPMPKHLLGFSGALGLKVNENNNHPLFIEASADWIGSTDINENRRLKMTSFNFQVGMGL